MLQQERELASLYFAQGFAWEPLARFELPKEGECRSPKDALLQGIEQMFDEGRVHAGLIDRGSGLLKGPDNRMWDYPRAAKGAGALAIRAR